MMSLLSVNGSAQEIDPYQLSLKQLGQIQCYTPSRELGSVEKAPSTITVITAEEIRQRGYRTLNDALQRVPGFITYADSYTHMFGHRGFVENDMSNYLLMIDEHKLNNQLFAIGNQAHLFMPLTNVKRIEVVRSPSSTLWGSDASAGIIHIITYDVADLQPGKYGALQYSTDVEFKNDRWMENILYGADFGTAGDLVVSLNRSESNGDFLPAYHADNDGYVLWPKARSWDPRWNLSDIYGPNYDIYTKYRNGDVTFLGRYSTTKPSRFQYSDRTTRHVAQWPRSHLYTDLRYTPELTNSLRLETSLFFDHHEGHFTNPPRYDFDYNNYGTKAIFTHQLFSNRIKAGIDYELRDFIATTFIETKSARPKIEHVAGVFLEENFYGIEDWSFTGGLRFDYNTLRSKGGNLSPRASVFHRLSKNWSVKYSYNTGHVRKNAREYLTFTDATTFDNVYAGAPWVGVEKSQRTRAHDLEVDFRSDKLWLSAVPFYMTIYDYATYIGYTYYNTPEEQAQTGWYGYEYIDQNLGDLNTRGIELDATYEFSKALKFYGNGIYSRAKLSDRYVTMRGGLHTVDIVAEPDMDLVNNGLKKTGWPKYIWNLGVDFEPINGKLINIHYRGWTKNPIKAERQPNEFDVFGPEHFVDVNFVMTALNGKMEWTLYGKNILNNKAKYPAPNDGGYTVNSGITVGTGIRLFLGT